MPKVRKCFWVDDRAFLMLTTKGIDPSVLINRIIAGFSELPEDPREKLIQEKSEAILIRLRISYEQELAKIVSVHTQEIVKTDQINKKIKENEENLGDLGNKLQKLSCFKNILRALQNNDMDNDYWDIALEEMNRTNGFKMDLLDFMTAASGWYSLHKKDIPALEGIQTDGSRAVTREDLRMGDLEIG